MLARTDLTDNFSDLPADDSSDAGSDLSSTLDPESVPTHALLLLYLMPVANRSDVDRNTAQAVEVLSDVQDRLSTPAGAELLDKETVALIYSTVMAIRFGKSE